MPNKLTALRFDQAANLVDDPANPHAKIVLFKRVKKAQPDAGSTHVDSPDWLKKDAEYLAARKEAGGPGSGPHPGGSKGEDHHVIEHMPGGGVKTHFVGPKQEAHAVGAKLRAQGHGNVYVWPASSPFRPKHASNVSLEQDVAYLASKRRSPA